MMPSLDIPRTVIELGQDYVVDVDDGDNLPETSYVVVDAVPCFDRFHKTQYDYCWFLHG